MESVPSDSRDLSALPLRYRGISGAIAHGLFIAGLIAGTGCLAIGLRGLIGPSATPVWHLMGRLALIGIGVGTAAGLARWICAGATNRLWPSHLVEGDFGFVGIVAGLILAGFLTQFVEPPADSVTPPAAEPILQLAGPTIDGGQFDLSNHRGKLVLVDFWATWCRPCLAELPNVRAAYEKYHDRGLEIVGVSFDWRREDLAGFLERQPTPWPHIFFDEDGSRGWENPLGRQYDIRAIPSMMLIDHEGRLTAMNMRGHQIEFAVADALDQSDSRGNHLFAAVLRGGEWFGRGLVSAPAWLLLSCVVGIAAAAASLEAATRRLFGHHARKRASE